MIVNCVQCNEERDKNDVGFNGICDICFEKNKTSPEPVRVSLPYFKEMGVENPIDPKGSTAHVRDIKNRRYDPVTDKMFYNKPKTVMFDLGGQ